MEEFEYYGGDDMHRYKAEASRELKRAIALYQSNPRNTGAIETQYEKFLKIHRKYVSEVEKRNTARVAKLISLANFIDQRDKRFWDYIKSQDLYVPKGTTAPAKRNVKNQHLVHDADIIDKINGYAEQYGGNGLADPGVIFDIVFGYFQNNAVTIDRFMQKYTSDEASISAIRERLMNITSNYPGEYILKTIASGTKNYARILGTDTLETALGKVEDMSDNIKNYIGDGTLRGLISAQYYGNVI
jgi:hypothetical protein